MASPETALYSEWPELPGVPSGIQGPRLPQPAYFCTVLYITYVSDDDDHHIGGVGMHVDVVPLLMHEDGSGSSATVLLIIVCHCAATNEGTAKLHCSESFINSI